MGPRHDNLMFNFTGATGRPALVCIMPACRIWGPFAFLCSAYEVYLDWA